MIAIIDYGMGNLMSAQKAFLHLGLPAAIVSSPEGLEGATHVVLPGVGAFPEAIARLQDSGMSQAVKEAVEAGTPLLGICLGMQLLFKGSYEGGYHRGLGLIDGEISRFDIQERVPHVGWNTVSAANNCPLFDGEESYYYFVHSYCATGVDRPWAGGITEYEKPFVSAVHYKNIYGTQFHPEKSGQKGLALLSRFAALNRGGRC